MLTFSYSADKDKNVSAHFKVKEFHSPKDPEDTVLVDEKLVELLENIRKFTGKPVIINSGYRSAAYNATIKGAVSNSQHVQGKAADIRITGVTPAMIARIAECYLGSSGGIGTYKTFTHVDVRTSCARWKGGY